MKIVLLGHMGRDEALADRLRGHELHIIGQWNNPGLVEKAEASGGAFRVVQRITDTAFVADYVQSVKPDMFLTNSDDALAQGVVDRVRERIPKLLIPCPDQAASRIEWDKFELRKLVTEIDASYNPVNFMVETADAVRSAISHFQTAHSDIAIKPRNLTGGKGVKVMGKHFVTYDEAKVYALQVLADSTQTGLEVQEKIEGHEFTLQIFTDGLTLIKPPTTYDYPYREDGDKGPGTGGMGAFSMQDGLMPFVTANDYDNAIGLMERLLSKLREQGKHYKGILYPTFFKTTHGLKIVEVNARGGDPELINTLDLLEDDVDLADTLTKIARGELDFTGIRFKRAASAIVYLVSPEYGYSKGRPYEFSMNRDVIESTDTKVRFAATERIGKNRYRTIGSSRSVGLSAIGSTPWSALGKIHRAIKEGFESNLPLVYRHQVADKAYIRNLLA